jgi:hypothetical protein
MNAKEVFDVAGKCAQKEGYDITHYKAQSTKKGAEWRIDFLPKGKKPRPGDFFSVYINDQSKSARLVRGK